MAGDARNRGNVVDIRQRVPDLDLDFQLGPHQFMALVDVVFGVDVEELSKAYGQPGGISPDQIGNVLEQHAPGATERVEQLEKAQ